MADMIDAKQAKASLGCDDATLQSYVNNGTIRAQRQGGKLLLNAEDVAKLAGGGAGDDDGTIVLTGDSDDLSIDLGKVVDDSVETIVQGKQGNQTESITFGDELEVVSFDDNQGTSELVFDETKQTGQAGNLSFTDSNTAVMTAVDETSVGATTAPIDFQTETQGSAIAGSSSRRSVRSQRAATIAESQPVHWIWPTLMVLTLLVCSFFILPYFIISTFPREDEKFANKDRAIGVDDNAWTEMAGGIAGFTVEPDKDKFTSNGGTEYKDIKDVDGQASWRIQEFRGQLKEKEARIQGFVIESVDEEANRAKGGHDTSYPISKKSTPISNGGGDQPESIESTSVDVYRP